MLIVDCRINISNTIRICACARVFVCVYIVYEKDIISIIFLNPCLFIIRYGNIIFDLHPHSQEHN